MGERVHAVSRAWVGLIIMLIFHYLFTFFPIAFQQPRHVARGAPPKLAWCTIRSLP